MPARSYLFVPGDKPEVLAKAGRRGADALIVDLEDAVAPGRKSDAREITSRWLIDDRTPKAQSWVRINSGETGFEDIRMLEDLSIEGVMIPKIGGTDDLAEMAGRLETVQPHGRLIVLVETARALRDIDQIAAHERVFQLMIGEADLGADIGMVPDDPAWDSIRVDVVVASAAAGIAPPIGPVDPDFSSPHALESSTSRLRDLGFASRAVIHPDQVGPVHRGLRPTTEQVAEAEHLLAMHEKSLKADEGVHVGEDGTMVDEAFVRRARRVLESARRGQEGATAS